MSKTIIVPRVTISKWHDEENAKVEFYKYK